MFSSVIDIKLGNPRDIFSDIFLHSTGDTTAGMNLGWLAET